MHGATKPAEWSDVDEKNLTRASVFIKNTSLKDVDEVKASLITWLKSLKGRVQPQNHWKPSKDQMTALRRMKVAVAGEGVVYKGLYSLYDDLVKLVGTGQ